MSDNTKFKKAIRARMERTGESYSTARMHLLHEKGAGDEPPSFEEMTRRASSWSGFGPNGRGVVLCQVYRGRWFVDMWMLCHSLQDHTRRGLRRKLREDWPYLLTQPGCLAVQDHERDFAVIEPLDPPVVIARKDDEPKVRVTERGIRLLAEHLDHPHHKALLEHIRDDAPRLMATVRAAWPWPNW